VTDTALRSLERTHQADPSPESLIRWLVARERAGEVCDGCSMPPPHWIGKHCPRCAGLTLRSRIELAAYCGSEGARLVLPLKDLLVCTPNRKAGFAGFVTGLARWGQHVLARAACAAARVAHDRNTPARSECANRRYGALDCGCSDCLAGRAIEAAEAYRDCPCEEHREAWAQALLPAVPLWTPAPFDYVPEHHEGEASRSSIQAAARLAGEQPVREAICADLIRWAISP